jgi:hypothetical protein
MVSTVILLKHNLYVCGVIRHRVEVSENRVLRRMFGPKREGVAEG